MIYGRTSDGKELKTQWETILYHLKETGAKVTAGGVWNEFGFARLSDIVYKIEKRAKVKLARRTIQRSNRYGGKVYITEYWYEKSGDFNNRVD